MKICFVAGARPNFVKVAPLMWALRPYPHVESFLINTGQHYDPKLSTIFFQELGIPAPKCDLGVGSGSHAQQTAEIMRRIEPVLLEQRPDAVVVVGDVNSTVAAAIVAAKLGFPVAHVEAGLRSFDRSMPEEINRILTDAISTWLFVSEESGLRNLANEGVPSERIHLVGNVMIDSLVACLPRIAASDVLQSLRVTAGQYCVLTLHRPATVDVAEVLNDVRLALRAIQKRITVVFPVHPRTRSKLRDWNGDLPNVRIIEPLGYLDFLRLVKDSRFVMTDSGGLQEETTFLHVPCLTLRANTERPATVEVGSNQLVGLSPDKILCATDTVLAGQNRECGVPELWDGKAAHRVITTLITSLADGNIVTGRPSTNGSGP